MCTAFAAQDDEQIVIAKVSVALHSAIMIQFHRKCYVKETGSPIGMTKGQSHSAQLVGCFINLLLSKFQHFFPVINSVFDL